MLFVHLTDWCLEHEYFKKTEVVSAFIHWWVARRIPKQRKKTFASDWPRTGIKQYWREHDKLREQNQAEDYD
jgi:hypothetical protein